MEPARPHHGHDAETAALDPALGGAALATTFETAERHKLEAHGVWTVAEDEHAVATSAGGGTFESTTDALMKVICIAPSGRSGYASSMGVAASSLEPGRWPSARPPRRSCRATRPSCRPGTTRS